MTWTPVTKQTETWDAVQRRTLGVGFSLGFARRPDFATALLAGVWEPKTEQPEVWTAA